MLDGLRDLLRRHRRRWDMAFVEGGAAALAELNATRADVIVSDMRMSGMDGAQLLCEVKARHPRVARLVLTGHADREAIFRALPVAQQFLSKPADPQVLTAAIDRACELQSMICDGPLAARIGGLDRLPSPPGVYWRITQAMADPNVSIGDLATILQEDPAVTAKLLQLVNSAYFGLPQPVCDLAKAVALLGLELVRALVLSAHVLHALDAAPGVEGFSIDGVQASSLLVAKVARRIAGGGPFAEACFTAGLLHDVGLIVLAVAFPEQLAELLRSSGEGARLDRERRLLGFTHAEAGGYLLGLWGLPNSIVEAVAFHHEPARAARGIDVVGVVHIADALVDECLEASAGIPRAPPLSPEVLAHPELAARLPAWRRVAKEETAAACSSRA
ncbi:MAG: HDOD domain-containing protein [Archangiaceae bacterium]|nr:HDOD domain-containing protein [Archangiaceae bacterium]